MTCAASIPQTPHAFILTVGTTDANVALYYNRTLLPQTHLSQTYHYLPWILVVFFQSFSVKVTPLSQTWLSQTAH